MEEHSSKSVRYRFILVRDTGTEGKAVFFGLSLRVLTVLSHFV